MVNSEQYLRKFPCPNCGETFEKLGLVYRDDENGHFLVALECQNAHRWIVTVNQIVSDETCIGLEVEYLSAIKYPPTN
jgi:predicted RNA-binding Zn-ribbon protein involved in translation (DUF1610 family)